MSPKGQEKLKRDDNMSTETNICSKRLKICQKRPRICQKRPIIYQKRPRICRKSYNISPKRRKTLKRDENKSKQTNTCPKRIKICQKSFRMYSPFCTYFGLFCLILVFLVTNSNYQNMSNKTFENLSKEAASVNRAEFCDKRDPNNSIETNIF